jgi:hypothetical protein
MFLNLDRLPMVASSNTALRSTCRAHAAAGAILPMAIAGGTGKHVV